MAETNNDTLTHSRTNGRTDLCMSRRSIERQQVVFHSLLLPPVPLLHRNCCLLSTDTQRHRRGFFLFVPAYASCSSTVDGDEGADHCGGGRSHRSGEQCQLVEFSRSLCRRRTGKSWFAVFFGWMQTSLRLIAQQRVRSQSLAIEREREREISVGR